MELVKPTIEKICSFYVSDWHLVTMLLPYINKEINEKDDTYQGQQWKSLNTLYEEGDNFLDILKKLKPYTVIWEGTNGDNAFYVGEDKKLYWLKDVSGNKNFRINKGGYSESLQDGFRYASGTLSAHGGLSYVNEAGLEGIITPQGTLTALPSKTGIVPADLTSNLYHLAEVAPNLIKTLDSASIRYPESGSTTNTTDNSTNVQNLYASFQATEDFDFDKFLVDVRGVINNTRHTA